MPYLRGLVIDTVLYIEHLTAVLEKKTMNKNHQPFLKSVEVLALDLHSVTYKKDSKCKSYQFCLQSGWILRKTEKEGQRTMSIGTWYVQGVVTKTKEVLRETGKFDRKGAGIEERNGYVYIYHEVHLISTVEYRKRKETEKE